MTLLRFTFMAIIAMLISTACAQDTTVGNYKIDKESDILWAETSILRAEEIFHDYTNSSPKTIQLYQASKTEEVPNKIGVEIEGKPIAYLCEFGKLVTKTDSMRMLLEFKETLSKETLVQYDASGNVTDFLSGMDYLPAKDGVTMDEAKKAHNENEKNKNKFLFKNDEKAVMKLAVFEYKRQNKEVEEIDAYLSFLWCNFFYEYFDISQPKPLGGIPRWVIDFSIIDATNMTSDRYSKRSRKLRPSKLYFLKKEYKLTWDNYVSGNTKILIPKKEYADSESLNVVGINMATHFELDDDQLFESVLFIEYMKEKYGKDVVKKMVKYYLDNDYRTMYFASFINANYGQKTNFKLITADFYAWVEGM